MTSIYNTIEIAHLVVVVYDGDGFAESIFDFENQAVLYLPPSMPDPRSPQWGRAAA